MTKILVFGNSGSGKSTLARHLCEKYSLAHLDLDTVAWQPTTPPQRAPLNESRRRINDFLISNQNWVVEGCYTDILELLEHRATGIIFMNLSLLDCISNAKARPWEPHKYPSKQAQDENIEMLIDWISQYFERDDEFSYAAHRGFYDRYCGCKTMITENQSPNSIATSFFI